MAGVINLDPQKGEELVSTLSSILNGTLLEVIQEGYDATLALGEGSSIVESMKENFGRIQTSYNDDVVPAVKAVNVSAEQFTDMAKYVNAAQTANSVKDIEVGKVGANNYDAAMNL